MFLLYVFLSRAFVQSSVFTDPGAKMEKMDDEKVSTIRTVRSEEHMSELQSR